jgi:hypothetical protein
LSGLGRKKPTLDVQSVSLPCVDPVVLPAVHAAIQATLGVYADIQAHCAELTRQDLQLQQEAAAFRDELRFVAQYVGITLPPVKPLNVSDPANMFANCLSDIEATVKLVTPAAHAARLNSADAPPGIVSIKANGTVLAVGRATLLEAPRGSLLANSTSVVWGHDLDADGNIVQHVNPRLFAMIINHLRLKALLPTANVYREDKAALDNVLAFYAMSEVPVKCI